MELFLHRRAFTLVELLVVIAIIGILVALLLPAIQAAREAARRSQCVNNLRNVALSVHNFHDSKKQFPAAINLLPQDELPAGTINHSTGNAAALRPNWVYSILPYLEEQSLQDRFVLATTSRSIYMKDDLNREVRATRISVMECPSDQGFETPYGLTPAGFDWAVETMRSMRCRATHPCTRPPGRTRPPKEESSGVNTGLKISQITDGTSHTLLVGEIRVGLAVSDP